MNNSAVIVLQYAQRFYVAPMSNPNWKLSLKRPEHLVEFIIYCINNSRYYERRELALKIAQAIDRRVRTEYGVLRVKIQERIELFVPVEDLYPEPVEEPVVLAVMDDIVEPTLETLEILYPNVA